MITSKLHAAQSDRRHMIVVIALAVTVILSAGLATALNPSDTLSLPFIVFCTTSVTAICLFTLSRFAHRLNPSLGLWNPIYVLVGYLGLLYIARPLYVVTIGEVGSHQIGRDTVHNMRHTIESTSLLLCLGIALFTAAFMLAPSGFGNRILSGTLHTRSTTTLALVAMGMIAALCAAIIFNDLRQYSGGWQVALTDRRTFFEGRVSLIWLMNLYRYGFMIWLALLLSGKLRMTRWRLLLAVGFWVFALITDALSGSRMEIILRNVLPVTALIAMQPSLRRNSKLLNVVSLVVLVVIFVGYRTVVRDSHIEGDRGVDVTTILEDVISLPTYLLEGDEAAAFDYLVFTRAEVPERLAHRGWNNVEAMAAAVVPSSFLPSKPERSSHILTRELRYSYSIRGGNIAFSGAADLYFSWGDAAVVIGLGGIGFLAGWVLKGLVSYRGPSPNAGIALLAAFTLAAAFVSVFRADLYELPLAFLRLTLLGIAVAALVQVKRSEVLTRTPRAVSQSA